MRDLRIILTKKVQQTILEACQESGAREIGGMLFAHHLSHNDFKVLEATIAGEYLGTFSRFVRGLASGLKRLAMFYEKHNFRYSKYNYLGDWHSHPNFALDPSVTDDKSMVDMLMDSKVGASFLVLLIVKISNKQLEAKAWAYFPDNKRSTCTVVLETADKAPVSA